MTKTITGTPLPEITDQTKPFWEATLKGKLVMQKCTQCGTAQFPRSEVCVNPERAALTDAEMNRIVTLARNQGAWQLADEV